MKKILIVRGMSINYILAIVNLICLYIKRTISWYNIINNNLLKKSITYAKLTNKNIQIQNLKIIHKCIISD